MIEPRTNNLAAWPEALVLAIASAGAAAYLWLGWCVFPLSSWNEVRLAPTFALRAGLPVYPIHGDGPLGTWIYGPLPLLLNLPATFAPSAMQAVLVAGLINLLTLALPLLLLSSFVPRWSARFTALAVCILLLPPRSLVFQVADHTAIAFGLIGCWWLTRSSIPRRREIIAAAACGILAASSKQTAVLVPVAHALYLLTAARRHLLREYIAWVAIFGLLAAMAGGAAFGWSGLWFNLLQVPARLPWGEFVAKCASRAPHLLGYVVAPLVLLYVVRRSRQWPDSSSSAGRLVHCAALVFVALLPLSLVAFFKIGGDTNVLHSSFYLLPAAAIAVFAANDRTSRSLSVLVLVAGAVAMRLPEIIPLPSQPMTKALGEMSRLAQVAPGSAWFPHHPLATYYSERRLYHVEDGISTRHLAGFGLSETAFRRHLPAQLNTVFYQSGEANPFAMQLLKDFAPVTRVDGWTIYQRVATPPISSTHATP